MKQSPTEKAKIPHLSNSTNSSGYMNAITNKWYHALQKKQYNSFVIVLELSSNDAFAWQHNWIFIFLI